MLKVFISIAAGVFFYCGMTVFLSSNGKVVVAGRVDKYLQDKSIDEIQRDVLREKRKKQKKPHSFQLASKDFSNYLAMSGVKLSGAEFLYTWGLFTVIPILLAFLLLQNTISVLGVGILCFAAPPLLVKRSRGKRQEEFNKQLGESLIIMRNCVKSGFSFQQAMESIATEMQPPISTEFAKVLREVRYGVTLEDALGHMVERVKNKDLDLLVSAVLLSNQVGGNLSDILEVISETIRDRLKIKAEVRVLTSSGRISGIIIGLLPVVIIVILMLLNPTYFESFFSSDIGKGMIALSVLLEAVGFTVINKIVDIKY